ncbi:M10 family metallopeptidase C-terminal domain-containing protein [Bradyrhizobium sp. 200]|uniref:M10 family metallopeptidase C-terminal domain-containing protein n=1 Tax=Bradyrhizobium sp. 200 TaxID=2782665 RepID=UPI002000357D|nr:M10 family metallopeptidase C-terminal domain-containing protein [Bradyrhizobium sp. 200]UPJ51940.1 M10 family metallopeptidase C-terminal domain-containing protein [Bradyrhizobium sp. 200]
MKKKHSPFDDAWTFAAPGGGRAPVAGYGATDDARFRDDGDPYQLANDAAVVDTLDTYAAKPVASIATLASYLVTGFWQYNNTVAHQWASNTITYNINGLNSAEQFLAQSALQAWSEVANITFVQTTGSANITFTHNGTMQAVTSGYWPGGSFAYATINISTDWVTTDGGANDGKTGIDSYAYQTYIHEIGHALGLGHQGPYNGSASYSTNALYANDTWQYSIMSYFGEHNYSGSSYRYVVTPQMADIYAVAAIYGAATSTRTGDTVYGFNSNAGAVFNFAAYTSAPALTIYDSGGTDTLDCSGYSAAQTIDLRSGAFSSVGGLVNNIGIALNAVIEKAIGGSGNDTLIANDPGCTLSGGSGNDTLDGAAGVDRLIGGTGRDTMTGNGGADTFVFASGESSAASGQHDLITDFTSADRIDIAALGAFRFLSTAAFDGGTYALNFFYNSSTGLTTLQGDINGDTIADFAIDLTGNVALTASYIIWAAPPVVIESAGATSLVRSVGNYYLNPVGGGTGPVLQFQGAVVSAGQFGDWTAIGAEATASGYEVAWYNAATNQYTFWYTDSSGKFVTNPTGPVAANSSTVQSFESSFHQDLNGDGVIGTPVVPPTVVEALGATSLVQSGGNYYLNPVGGGTGPVLQFQGAVVSVGQFAGWTTIGAEATASGYEVAWYSAATNQYTFWYTDSSGKFVTNPTGPVAANSSTVQSFESSFQQDLNGDGVIGAAVVPSTVVEALGVTSLVQSGGNYYLNPVGGGTGPVLQFQGAVVSVGQFAGWTTIGAEATASGYEVAWYSAATNQYTFWYTDGSGKFVTNPTGPVAANSSTVQSFESSFHQDLNGDGVIGTPVVPPTVVEALGVTSLVQSGGNYYLNPVGGGTGPVLQFQGSVVSVGQFAGWTAIGTEATASGYEVAWYNAGTNQYTFWYTDSSGKFVTNPTGPVAANSSTVQSFESSFQQDLNGDGVISQQPISTASLLMGSEQSALVFDFRSDLGQQAPNLHVLDDRMAGHPLANELRSVIDAASEYLPAAAPEADHNMSKILAAHFDQFLFH